MISVLNSPIMGPLIVFACNRTAEGATRMADITPRDIRRVTAFFTMYREGNPCVSFFQVYPSQLVMAVMISDPQDKYNMEMGLNNPNVAMREIHMPLRSCHSSYAISLAFVIGLPWYIRHISPMKNDAEGTGVSGSTMAFNCDTALRWIRHTTHMDFTALEIDQSTFFDSTRRFFTGSGIIFSGTLQYVSPWYILAFDCYMEECFNGDIMPSKTGFKDYWEHNTDGTSPSPYLADEEMAGRDVFAPGQAGDFLRNVVRENIAQVWRDASYGYKKGKSHDFEERLGAYGVEQVPWLDQVGLSYA